MKRLTHGSSAVSDDQAPHPVTAATIDQDTVQCPPKSAFDYLFAELQDPADFLPEGENTAQTLIDLGNSMTDFEPQDLDPEAAAAPPDPALNSNIPSAYTYFGQFITHEIVFEDKTKSLKMGPLTKPLDRSELAGLTNGRTSLLDLDSVYGPIVGDDEKCFPVPQTGEELTVKRAANSRVPGTDVPREKEPLFTARIGDRRNDANLITSQMHLAFLRAHNKLVNSGLRFNEARRTMRQHFQWLVVSDYLPRIADPAVLKKVMDGTIEGLDRLNAGPFMPLEFSVAAFRFGHSMPRKRYHYNQSYTSVKLSDLFLPRTIGYYPVLDEWIIDWNQFLPGGTNVARRIDTRLVQPLFHLIDEQGNHVKLSLAALDLLRGYLLHLPTGQAVARELGLPVIRPEDIESVAETMTDQKAILASGLSSRTPLWFYILAEAAHVNDGAYLGPVGSTIVAGVLIALVRHSNDSILNNRGWKPTLGNGHFTLTDLFRLAEVLPN